MNEVNALWVSPWFELQRNLASSVAHKGFGQRRLNGEPQGVGDTPAATSWLFRARVPEHSYSV
jgi:hypothetical protein